MPFLPSSSKSALAFRGKKQLENEEKKKGLATS